MTRRDLLAWKARVKNYVAMRQDPHVEFSIAAGELLYMINAAIAYSSDERDDRALEATPWDQLEIEGAGE